MVLRAAFQEDPARGYGFPALGTRPLHNAGQVYYGDRAKPAGFCDAAWKAIYQ